jgi:tetratricopeptide (TPR) repeat protein
VAEAFAAWRVAQILVDRGAGRPPGRGSGYLVRPGRVLTAAHVLAGAVTITVLLDVGEPGEIRSVVDSHDCWADPAPLDADNSGRRGTDLAIVSIPEDAIPGRDVFPAMFGTIRADDTAVLQATAYGYPAHKLRTGAANVRPGESVRDLDMVRASTPVIANRRQRTLALYLQDPPPAQGIALVTQEPEGCSTEPPQSPWAGFSGAAVWSEGRIIAIVGEHHAAEGPGRLTGRRIDRLYSDKRSAELSQLRELLTLPSSVEALDDVVPTSAGSFIRSAYLAQVRDIAPDVLVGRENELAAWAQFCAQGAPYVWWQAGPWTGKSALASWFVTHPPAGVEVISFFITGRLAGQADANAFLDATIEQLRSLPGIDAATVAEHATKGTWLDLLDRAAGGCENAGRRLVVVVDGLDEDETGAVPTRGRPSIASLLPRRPHPNVRIIATSRPDPGLPDDLPGAHPLRTCAIVKLGRSWISEDIERRAKQELRDLFTAAAADALSMDVVGYVAGAGGGLTMADLQALTGAPPHRIDGLLRGVFGRTLRNRAATSPPGRQPNRQANSASRVFLFAHETLRVEAEAQLGHELTRYRDAIHAWIDTFRNQGWPDSTPAYALRGYPRLLIATDDVARASDLATDPDRHAVLFRAAGNDYAALQEISAALDLHTRHTPLDLPAQLGLATWRHALSTRGDSLPTYLIPVWTFLGRAEHAEALARTITSPDRQGQALSGLVEALALAGQHDRAEALTRTITRPDRRAEALIGLVRTLVQAGQDERAGVVADDAQALARTITDPERQERALISLVYVLADAGQHDRAHALAGTLTELYLQGQALIGLVRGLAQAGQHDHAESLARTIADPNQQGQALSHLVRALARAGQHDRAEILARRITHPDRQAEALASLAQIFVEAGRDERALVVADDAEAVARTITDPDRQAEALTGLMEAFAHAGQHDRAQALAQTIGDPYRQGPVLSRLVQALLRVGQHHRAEIVVGTITDSYWHGRALTDLVQALAQAGQHDRAEGLAQTITDPNRQAEALTGLVQASAQVGELGRAQALIRTFTDPYWRAEALTGLAHMLVEAGQDERALIAAGDAEAVARTITDPERQAEALTGLSEALALAGQEVGAEAVARTITDPDQQVEALTGLAQTLGAAGPNERALVLIGDAEAVARTITDSDQQAQALTRLSQILAQAGHHDRAEALAWSIAHPYRQAEALRSLAQALAEAGHHDRAEALARTITHPYVQGEALSGLVHALAQAGHHDRAEALARTITHPYLQTEALTSLAHTLAQAGRDERALVVAGDAEAQARTISDPYLQTEALTSLAQSLAQAGRDERALALIGDAEAQARTITHAYWQAKALTGLVQALARAGDHDRARALSDAITDPDLQAKALAELAQALAHAGQHDRAERLARNIADAYRQAEALTALVQIFAEGGQRDRAQALARTIIDPDWQAEALINIATVMATEGSLQPARSTLSAALNLPVGDIKPLAVAVARMEPTGLAGKAPVLLECAQRFWANTRYET